MENRRPTQNIALPVKSTNGAANDPVSCTIKQPKNKLSSAVRQRAIRIQMLAEECNALYMETGPINKRIADATVFANRLKAQKASEQEVKDALASVGAIRDELTEIESQINALNDQQVELLFDQLADIVNIPNGPDGPRTFADAIDTDECDLTEIREAVNFFLNGASK